MLELEVSCQLPGNSPLSTIWYQSPVFGSWKFVYAFASCWTCAINFGLFGWFLGKMFCCWIGPGRGATFIVSVEHQAGFRIVQVTCINDELLRGFVISISAVAIELAVSD